MGIDNLQNVPRNIKEGICEVLGNARRLQFLKLLHVESGRSKADCKVVALAEYSIQILSAKSPVKLEQSFNFLDIRSIDSPSPDKVTFATDSKKITLICKSGNGVSSSDIDEVISCVCETLVIVFPEITQTLMGRTKLAPASRLNDLADRLADVKNKDASSQCGSFTFAYHCMCDYHNVPFAEEVAWDIDTIYVSHACKELMLSDFDHLDARYLPPIVSALEYNAWFTKLNLTNVRMTAEIGNEVIKVMKNNSTITELVLSNTGIKADFVQKLAASLSSNQRCLLTTLNLSCNSIEDKGLSALLPVIGKMSGTLSQLNLSKTGVTGKGVNQLAKVLASNSGFSRTLSVLDLSDNSILKEEITNLHSFLSQPNALAVLNLSGMDCSLEPLFAALSRGCVHRLTHLDLSRNIYTTKKLKSDSVVPMAWKDFFTDAVSLQCVSFAGIRLLPTEALNFVLVGLSHNKMLKNLDLNLSSLNLGNNGSQVLECLIGDISCIGSLDISDNNFDHTLPGLLSQLGKNHFIRKLAIGKNKPRMVGQFMEAVVSLIQREHSSLRCLLLDDLKLRGDLSILLSALGSNNTLTELDISGNLAGDICARMLSKALVMNMKLSTVCIDRNGISPQGFTDIAAALEKNFTLKKLPVAINDAMAALRVNLDKTEQALQKIENLLQRNREPHRLPMEQVYRLTHGLMASSAQQMIDNAMMQLYNMISKLQSSGIVTQQTQDAVNSAQNLIRDVGSARQILLEFERVAAECESDSGAMSTRLKSVAADLQGVVDKQLKSSVDAMMLKAEKQCSAIFSAKLKDDLRAGTANLAELPADHVRNAVMQRLSCDLLNAVNDVNFNVARYLYNSLVEEFMTSLDNALNRLKPAVVTAPVYVEDKKRGQKQQTAAMPDIDESKIFRVVNRTEELRKTLYCRKLRPQSSFGSADSSESGAMMTRTPVEMGEAKRAADATRRAESQPAPMQQRSYAHQTGTTRSIFSPSFDYDDLLPDEENPKLSHPTKERPQMRKTHFVKRPVIACESLLITDADLEEGGTMHYGSMATLSPTAGSDVNGNIAGNRSPMLPRTKQLTSSSSDESSLPQNSVNRSDSNNSDTLLSPTVVGGGSVSTSSPVSPEPVTLSPVPSSPPPTLIIVEPPPAQKANQPDVAVIESQPAVQPVAKPVAADEPDTKPLPKPGFKMIGRATDFQQAFARGLKEPAHSMDGENMLRPSAFLSQLQQHQQQQQPQQAVQGTSPLPSPTTETKSPISTSSVKTKLLPMPLAKPKKALTLPQSNERSSGEFVATQRDSQGDKPAVAMSPSATVSPPSPGNVKAEVPVAARRIPSVATGEAGVAKRQSVRELAMANFNK